MFRLTWRAFSASSPFRIIGKRRAGSSGGEKLKYVEPTGFLFNRRPGEAWKNWSPVELRFLRWMFYILVGVVIMHYKPDRSLTTWSTEQALDRIRKRGIDIQEM